MLTKRQNLLETIHGGNPDRFVNQYEFIEIMFHPALVSIINVKPGLENVKSAWGYTQSWLEGQPGAFPVHTPDKIVIKDFARWKDYVEMPKAKFSDAEWEPFIADAEAVDRNEQFVAPFMAPGLFEMTHYLGEITNALCAYYEEPEAVKELIKYVTEFELMVAEDVCDHMKPDALFHHDDWGTQNSTFISPDMFEEFFLDAYTEIYSYWKSRGVELVVHHSDCYAATFVPSMIKMGIDIWQGCMTPNKIDELIAKYGGQISFMGGIDDADVDFPGWTPADIERVVRKCCDDYGHKYFIPCNTHGLALSVFPGVYEETTKAIDEYSKIVFAK